MAITQPAQSLESRLADEALRASAKNVREFCDSLTKAHAKAHAAVENGGPDFRERIQLLRDQAESLCNDITTSVGPYISHGIADANAHPDRDCGAAGCGICETLYRQ